MSIIIFLAVLAILILSHELGHFILAKLNGVRVDEFGFGFPPRIFGFKKGETLYSLNLIPFGGFVKVYGEEGEGRDDKRSFINKPVYTRALILAAGVFFNLLLVWPVLSAGYMVGAPVSVENNEISGGTLTSGGVMILQVQENTPAETAGLAAGDYLLRLSVNNEILEISDVESSRDFIAKHAGNEIQIDYLRKGKEFSVKASTIKEPELGKGNLGILMDYVAFLKLPFFKAVGEGFKTTLDLIGAVARAFINFFANIFTRKELLAQVAGPVGIAGIVSSAHQAGFVFILQLVALLSVNLALINIIPFPALDGGRLLFLSVEFIKGKPISQKAATIANNIGFTILIGLMLLITYRDILRLF